MVAHLPACFLHSLRFISLLDLPSLFKTANQLVLPQPPFLSFRVCYSTKSQNKHSRALNLQILSSVVSALPMPTEMIKSHLKNISSCFFRIFHAAWFPRAGRRPASGDPVGAQPCFLHSKVLQDLASQAWQEMPEGGGRVQYAELQVLKKQNLGCNCPGRVLRDPAEKGGFAAASINTNIESKRAWEF